METGSIHITKEERTRAVPFAERLERVFLRHRQRFWIVHLAVLLFMAALLVIPVLLPLPGEEAAVLDDFSLFANFIIWGIWFPLLFLSVILFGRLWCGVFCPQGALSEYAGKKGLALTPPRWLRKDWIAIASFIVVTIFGQVVGVRDYPVAALEVLGGTTLIAVAVGYIYGSGRRVWCRYLCPMGPLLGVLSRFGAVSFERDGAFGRGYKCPTFINTAVKSSSANCIECFRCVNPGEKGSLRLKLRMPGSEVEDVARREAGLWEVLFLFSATGLALGAFYWQVSPLYIQLKHTIGDLFMKVGLLHLVGVPGPRWLMVNYPEAGEVFLWLDFISITLFMTGAMTAVTLLLAVFTAAAAFIDGKTKAFGERFVNFGYVYGPVALLSLVIGLGQILFQTVAGLWITQELARFMELTFLAAGGLWSVHLARRLSGGNVAAMVPLCLGAGTVAVLWYGVLL